MKKKFLLYALFTAFVLHGCATSSKGPLVSTNLSTPQIKSVLNQQHTQWKGVRYKMGGTNRNGVDCSGFIYRTFKDGIGISLPRSTELQSGLGEYIDRDKLRPGDLVFFKTGSLFKSRHVGVYMGNGQFLHASTSRGVMKSRLSNPYWKDAYWQSRRILK